MWKRRGGFRTRGWVEILKNLNHNVEKKNTLHKYTQKCTVDENENIGGCSAKRKRRFHSSQGCQLCNVNIWLQRFFWFSSREGFLSEHRFKGGIFVVIFEVFRLERFLELRSNFYFTNECIPGGRPRKKLICIFPEGMNSIHESIKLF